MYIPNLYMFVVTEDVNNLYLNFFYKYLFLTICTNTGVYNTEHGLYRLEVAVKNFGQINSLKMLKCNCSNGF